MMKTLPPEVIQALQANGITLKSFHAVAGGCINNGGTVETSNNKRYFLKWNDVREFHGMFAAEAKGLALLADANTIRIPKVVHSGVEGTYQYLLLEYIFPTARREDFWKNFGEQLAMLHLHQTELSGLDHDNFIGSLHQANQRRLRWRQFFAEERILPMVRKAFDNRYLTNDVVANFEKLITKLEVLIPDEKPSLLHGDLWGGNLIADGTGAPCLIDPAVYYGHREMDLAMTFLFGGFDEKYLKSYNEVFPLVNNYKERFDLYNLYPLLAHVNLFGKSYVSQVVSILRKFV